MKEIPCVFVFVSELNGNEGIIMVKKQGLLMALVTSDEEDLPDFWRLAKMVSTAPGVKVKLLRFSTRTVMADRLKWFHEDR